ncbi:MAG: DUF2283 domain-containing protein [Planctomycetes bacterium]|nr:DUF2283 domain-containing protein [Planctomycetota bacterium]
MKLTCDAQDDALHLRLAEAPRECRVVRLNDEVAVDCGDGDGIVGVEVLNAHRLLAGGGTPAARLQNLLGRPAQG